MAKMTLPFVKMQGIGNDFVVADCLVPVAPTADALQAASVHLCDRQFGVGADGVLLVLPSDKADFTMRMFNPDGTESEMCGNGIRCFAKYVFDHGHTAKSEIAVDTGGGVKTLVMTPGADGKIATVRVDMGEPGLTRADLPMTGEQTEQAIGEPVEIGGEVVALTAVSMGNPHAVFFTDAPDEAIINRLGPQIEPNALFPRKINVHAVTVHNDHEITLLTWERGAGRTLACGTGACASVVASVLNGKTGRRVLAHLPGGDLQIEWSAENNRVYMTGPAQEAFRGTITL